MDMGSPHSPKNLQDIILYVLWRLFFVWSQYTNSLNDILLKTVRVSSHTCAVRFLLIGFQVTRLHNWFSKDNENVCIHFGFLLKTVRVSSHTCAVRFLLIGFQVTRLHNWFSKDDENVCIHFGFLLKTVRVSSHTCAVRFLLIGFQVTRLHNWFSKDNENVCIHFGFNLYVIENRLYKRELVISICLRAHFQLIFLFRNQKSYSKSLDMFQKNLI